MTTSKMANRLGIRTLLEDATVLRTLLSSSGIAPTIHALLGSYHSDAATDAVTAGSLIYGNATPQWDELVIGTAHQLLKVNVGGTAPAWASFDWDDMAAGASADMVHAHTSNAEGGLLGVAAISDLAYATPALTLGTANAAGAANSVIRSDATILAFDVTVPTTIAVGDTAATGSAAIAARRDHLHGITSSANPGAAASILASDASGELQLAGLYISPNQIRGGFGAEAGTGTLDFDDVTNARSGSGYTLLQGSTASNSPTTGANDYWHTFSFEYANKDGTGNLTQFAIPYGIATSMDAGMYMRGRYSGSWGNWCKILSENTSGKVGIGTTTIPHGAVGAAMFAMDGVNASVAGPHVQYTTAADNYPVFQQLNWGHDGISLVFDAYYDGAWKSSDAGSNFHIHKNVDLFKIEYDSGVAQGGAVTWVNGLTLHTSGNVHIGNPPTADARLVVYDSAVGDVAMRLINDANDATASGMDIICGADAGSGVTYYIMGRDGNGDEVGGLWNNNGTFQVFDSSDEATKTNIARTAWGGLEIIRQLKVRDYNRAKFPDGPRLTGFVAQEVEGIVPGMVAATRDGTLATSSSALIPFLVLAIQEQQEQIGRLGRSSR